MQYKRLLKALKFSFAYAKKKITNLKTTKTKFLAKWWQRTAKSFENFTKKSKNELSQEKH